MDKRYFIELTNRLYRLSFFFPQKEPLRHKIREVADEILANLTLILEGEVREKRESAFVVEGDIEILITLLELVKSQNWVESREVVKVQEDYATIKQEIEDFNDFTRQKQKLEEPQFKLSERKPEKEEKPAVQKKKEKKLNKRQEKILQLLEKKEKLQVKDVQEVLPKTVKRTLRRDLGGLTEQGLVKREGSGNTTYYAKIGH